MQNRPRVFRGLGGIGILIALAGCSYQAAIQQLPPEEQTTFRVYNHVMSPRQARTYLAQDTGAARAAYLNDIGISQRFQAFAQQDRDALLAGYIRKGMEADAVRFLWGEPYHTRGYTGHYEYWHYLGSAFTLAAEDNAYTEAGTEVVVYLVDNKVDWWIETVPTDIDRGGDDNDVLRQ